MEKPEGQGERDWITACAGMTAGFGAAAGNRTLVIFVHGDGSRGGPSDYLANVANGFPMVV